MPVNPRNFSRKPVGGVVVMVQVNLDFSEAGSTQIDELAHVLRSILFLGIKERVAWRLAIGVPMGTRKAADIPRTSAARERTP